jgi:protoporphyrin/coproporphyrin ferrochelatase
VARFTPEPAYQHGTIPRTGILLMNLGTPDEPTAMAVRRYLREFLSDPRVVEIPRAIWWPILHGIILRTRPSKSAAKYAAVWMPEGSPLRVHTERHAELLHGYLGERARSPLAVQYAMRYGNPSVASALEKLRAAHCDRLLLLPLYPQYAASTTATGFDAVARELAKWRNQPALRTVKHFHDHPGYIGALAQSVRSFWTKNGRPEMLLMSFHGIPKYALEKGDPYHCECHKTARLLAAALQLKDNQYVVAFQSRFGRAEWLKPYTGATIQRLAKDGKSRIHVICPGFVCDCLETLEEIGLEGKQTFLRAGGKEYHLIPCLNERDDWIRALTDIALESLQGWVGTQGDAAQSKQIADESRARALALGATR